LLAKDFSLESNRSTAAMDTPEMDTPDRDDDKKPLATDETEEKNDNDEDDTKTYEGNPYGLGNTTKEEVRQGR
jgi:hypothetical protein